MTKVSRSHRITFETQYHQRPEIRKHIDEGVDVLESFEDDAGNEHYCHAHPTEALEQWLLEFPEDHRDTRKEFVEEITAISKSRRDMTLYNVYGFEGEAPPVRNKVAEDLYMAGVKDAISNIFGMTDDRNPKGGKWRLTTTEGEVVPFCNPKDKEYMETPGIIVMFHDAISS